MSSEPDVMLGRVCRVLDVSRFDGSKTPGAMFREQKTSLEYSMYDCLPGDAGVQMQAKTVGYRSRT